MYSSMPEFMICYLDNKLTEYNKKITDEYIKYNYNDKHFGNETLDIKYINGCFCYLDEIENCQCEDNIQHYNDDFMKNKFPMFPKNSFFQKYYEDLFPKRIFLNKIFYYLPKGSKTISIKYINETTTNKYDISRTIIYYFINNKIVLIQDKIEGWFGIIFNHYHTPESEKINNYMEILNIHDIHSNNVIIIQY
jgi:hypothetical protein